MVDVLERTMRVTNGLGLHARVATRLVQLLQNYSCQVTLKKDDMEVDARSVLGLLLLAAAPGTVVVAKATGPDSEQALDEMSRLIEHEES
jgi:phosphocarrier protein